MDISDEWKAKVGRWFPELEEGVSLEFTSDPDPNYNCLAWSVSCDSQYFENAKGSFWPWVHLDDDTPEGWAGVCELHGFQPIPIENIEFVPGIEKIAILVNEEGELHATRQWKNGWWKSKLGSGPDIDHSGLAQIQSVYGKVVHLLQRVRPDWIEAEG
jgi:hypothetical protein